MKKRLYTTISERENLDNPDPLTTEFVGTYGLKVYKMPKDVVAGFTRSALLSLSFGLAALLLQLWFFRRKGSLP